MAEFDEKKVRGALILTGAHSAPCPGCGREYSKLVRKESVRLDLGGTLLALPAGLAGGWPCVVLFCQMCGYLQFHLLDGLYAGAEEVIRTERRESKEVKSGGGQLQ